MLEPAVRPGGLPGPQRAANTPIESRSFESLLEEAKAAAEPTAGETKRDVNTTNPLKSLSRIDLIDNAALLELIGGRGSHATASSSGDAPD